MSAYNNTKIVLIVQMLITIAVITFVPNSILQTLLLVMLWMITFRSVTRFESLLFLISVFFFTLGDIVVTQRNIFQFVNQDIFGLPYYEPFIWGYYFLHALRMLKQPTVVNLAPGMIFATLYFLVLAFMPGEIPILLFSGIILGTALLYFRTLIDFQYTIYFIILGLVIEVIGTKHGVWQYHIEHEVTWWIITWGAAGLILYRTIVPLTYWAQNYLKLKH